MRKPIDISIQIDSRCSGPEVIIKTNRMTPDVETIVAAIENSMGSDYPMIPAYDGDRVVLTSQREIVRVYAENRKVVVCTERGSYVSRKTLAELELTLNPSRFMRISRSEIINLYQVSSFDFSLSGTIRVHFDDGSDTWASRRYVRHIQETLGVVERRTKS